MKMIDLREYVFFFFLTRMCVDYQAINNLLFHDEVGFDIGERVKEYGI